MPATEATEMNMNEDDDISVGDIIVMTPEEMLATGLRLAGYKDRSIERCQAKTNLERFISRYGADPAVLAAIWEDLQRTSIGDAYIDPANINVEYFFHAFYFLKHYDDEQERAANTGWCRDTCRDWGWFYAAKIRALKADKIVWPTDNTRAIWIMTVDGTHCWYHEPPHPEFSINTDYYSQKFNHAGLNYKLGMSLNESRLIWMNGPFRAGLPDRNVFRDEGLRDKLRQLGQKAIADAGYHAEEDFDVVSTPNNMDSDLVKKFKRRALKRHEKFNGLLKTFKCLDQRFRHSEERFAICFEACAVICQYALECDKPLYNILVRGM